MERRHDDFLEPVGSDGAADAPGTAVAAGLLPGSSRQWLSDLLACTTDLVWEIDASGVLRQLVGDSEGLLGQRASALLGRAITSLTLPGDHARLEQALAAPPPAGEPLRDFELWLRRSDGSACCLLANALPLYGGDGRFHGYRGIARDVTGRREVVEALRASQQKLAMHVEQTPVAVIGFDTEFRITEWNPAAARMFGYDFAEVRGRHAADVILPEVARAAVDEIWQQLLRGVANLYSVNENVTKDGEFIICEWHNTPLVDEHGRVIGVTSLCQNLTARVEQEQALLAARQRADRANMLKSEFLASMSHELRTPLHGILSFAQLGRRRAGRVPADKLREYFDHIKASGERLRTLLDGLLDLSKLEAGKLTIEFASHDLGAIVEACIAEQDAALREKHIAIHTHWERAGLPAVACDKVRIGQVVFNFLNNAIKFSPPGSRIDLRIAACEIDDADGRPCAALQVEMSDRGRGIPADEIDSIFDKFTQSRRNAVEDGGTGLGLAIARELVNLHRGTIWARNNPAAGATFGFAIPLRRAP